MIRKLISLFINFFMIGLFTLGGGYAMITLIIERVTINNWLSIDQLYEFIGISEATPGSFAVNVSTFIGYNQASFIGAFTSTLAVILPSFIILVIIARFGDKFLKSSVCQSAFKGIRPVVVGLVASVALGIVFKNTFGLSLDFFNIDFSNLTIDWKSLTILFIIAMLALVKIETKDGKKKQINPIILIIISGILGAIIYSI